MFHAKPHLLQLFYQFLDDASEKGDPTEPVKFANKTWMEGKATERVFCTLLRSQSERRVCEKGGFPTEGLDFQCLSYDSI